MQALSRLAGTVAVFFLGLAAGHVWAQDRAGGLNLQDLLPESGETGEWKPEADIQVFNGEDLFTHIDGGAEIFLEYGFIRAAVRDYKSGAGKTICLEMYEMKNPAAAYGIYSFKKSAQGRNIETDPDSEAQLADYYLNLWKGRFLVTLTGFDESAGTRDGLLLLVKATARKIKDRAEKPLPTQWLPENGLNKAGVRYLLGNLGLFNVYPFDPAGVFAVEEGVTGNYGDGQTAVILKYTSKENAGKLFSDARLTFDQSVRYREFKQNGDARFSMKDGKGRNIIVTRSGPLVLIALGMDEPKAQEIFDLILRRAGR